jgi:hypothetical protein
MRKHQLHRRDALRAGLAAMTIPIAAGMRPAPAREVRSFRLTETAGLRRFGYPVHALVPDAADGRNFRLTRDGRAIPAQFRTVPGVGGKPEVALDFVVAAGPLESARYEVLFGPDVEPASEPKSGLAVEKRDSQIFVSQGSSLTFEIAEDLSGFLRSVGSPRLGYVREGSVGLAVREQGAESFRPVSPGPIETKVSRQGPFAVGLAAEWSGPGNARSRLDLTFPHSKSWVQAIWSVDDPDNRIAGLSLDLNLLVEGAETLVDLGAGSTIYGQLKKNQSAELVSGRAEGEPVPSSGSGWVVRLGEGAVAPIFASSTGESPRPAEGWAHVMDVRRCTALAVAGFGRSGGRDSIRASHDGRINLVRDYSVGSSLPKQSSKSLAFWLHFVPMPVQVGALTSAQSILSPLQVEWDRPPT